MRLVSAPGFAVALTILVGCGQPVPLGPGDDVIATVAGNPVSTERFEAELARLEQRGIRPDPARVLADLLRREQLLERARRKQLDRDPEVRRAFESLLIARLEEIELNDRRRSDTRPTVPRSRDATNDASTILASAPGARASEPRMRVAVLRLDADSSMREERWHRLESRLLEARSKAVRLPPEVPGFGPLAAEYSDDPATRLRGGDVGWIATDPSRSNLDPAVVRAAAALTRSGDVSHPVRGRDGLYLVKLVDRREKREAASDWDENLTRHQAVLQRRQAFEEEFRAETDRLVPAIINSNALTRITATRETRRTEPPRTH